ncbi:MAG: AMP-binding protein [Burkholderiaceae bacterium]|nr:AMP-binding protein [Burkholderiaceae bacterium]
MDLIGDRTLRDLIEERVALYGEREFLIFEDQEGRVERYTYREFDERVNQVANGLLVEGVQLDDKVVIHLPNSPAFLITWFALAKIGAVMVPTNTANTSGEMEYVLRTADATMVVTEVQYLEMFNKVLPSCSGIRRVFVARTDHAPAGTQRWDGLWQGQPSTLAPIKLSNEATLEILFTSGTTAQPKGVMLTHANSLWSGERVCKQIRLAPGERNLTALPCFHVNAQSISTLASITAGATLVLLEIYSATKFWEQVRRHRANVISLVPALMRTIAAQPPRPDDRDHALRVVFYAINCTDKEKTDFEERFGVSFLNGYGLSEAQTIVTMAPLDGNRKWPSIGLPAVDRRIRVVDDLGDEVPRGQVGELLVWGVPGRTIMKGYYKNPEETAAAVKDGWLHTGDNAIMDEAGYLYFFDRKKDVIKRGGENVSASEVEMVLMEHPGVLECAVIGVPDQIKDEAVKAFVVPRPNTGLTVEEVLAHCTARLAKFKIPQLIELREVLPKTSIGKIEKKVIRNEEQKRREDAKR